MENLNLLGAAVGIAIAFLFVCGCSDRMYKKNYRSAQVTLTITKKWNRWTGETHWVMENRGDSRATVVAYKSCRGQGDSVEGVISLGPGEKHKGKNLSKRDKFVIKRGGERRGVIDIKYASP